MEKKIETFVLWRFREDGKTPVVFRYNQTMKEINELDMKGYFHTPQRFGDVYGESLNPSQEDINQFLTPA